MLQSPSPNDKSKQVKIWLYLILGMFLILFLFFSCSTSSYTTDTEVIHYSSPQPKISSTGELQSLKPIEELQPLNQDSSNQNFISSITQISNIIDEQNGFVGFMFRVGLYIIPIIFIWNITRFYRRRF